MSTIDLKDLLAPVTAFLAERDLTEPAAVERDLAEAFPPGGETWSAIETAARAGLDSGAICDRGESPVRFSRVLKPDGSENGLSIDTVLLESTDGPRHTHPRGEVSLCLALDGEPTFDGREGPTWVVLPPGSSHVPSVRGGTILFFYWWPGGEVVWE